MGKFLKTILVGLLAGFLLISAQAEAAPDTLTIIPSGSAEEPVLTGLFVGQTHRYKVIFRGNGEAIVYANIDFTNTTDNKLSEFVFETPVNVRDMTILQYDKVTCPTDHFYDSLNKDCVMRGEYFSSAIPSTYYYGTQNVYQRAKFVQDGNRYTVTLPTPLEVNGDSFLLLGFTTKEFTTDFLGGYEYSFESLTVDSRITSLTINIDVDGGLLLKNASSASVNYSMAGAEKAVAPDTAVVNEDLDQLVSYMSYSGSISKQFMELSYGETATMTGEYASTWLRLYMKEIGVVVLIIVLFFVALFIGVKLYKKYHKSSPKNGKLSSDDSKMWILADTATGFGSALLIVLFTLAIMFLGGYLAYISYDYSYGYAYGMFMFLFIIITVLVYGFLALFGPIYRGRKRGWLSFGLTFFSEILFLIIIAFIFIGIIIIPRSYPIPY